jgi:hypothetical protein
MNGKKPASIKRHDGPLVRELQKQLQQLRVLLHTAAGPLSEWRAEAAQTLGQLLHTA